MKSPYLFRRMGRRKKLCFTVCIIAFVTVFLIYGLHIGDRAMGRKIDEIYDNSVVTCSVTNLTGTQSDNLQLSPWVVHLFQEPAEDNVHIPETSFLDYVKDVQMKISMRGSVSGQSIDLIGITALAADHSLRPEENTVSWFAGFDDAVFSGTDPVCMVSEDICHSLGFSSDAGGCISLEVYGKFNHNVVSALNLTIAGICNGKQGTIYCPWAVAADTYTAINGGISADCIYATILDNRKIAEFEERCVSKYFAKVDPQGKPQLWEDSAIYETYPYAFAIYDGTMAETISSLRQNQSVYRIFMKIILVLTLGIGFIIGNLSAKQRQKELALQYVLGLSKGMIFAEVWVEYQVMSGIGFAAAIAVLWVISGVAPPWGYLAAAFGVNCIGVALAALSVLRREDILQVVKRGD